MHCQECLGAFVPREASAIFCSTACRQAFKNRRAVRGQAMYDLFMALRYDRRASNAMKVWSLLCALAQQYREEDATRHGQDWRSWQAPAIVLRQKPWLRAKAATIRP